MGVLEAFMCSRSSIDILRDDISCLMDMLQEFVTCIQERRKVFIAIAIISKKENSSLSIQSGYAMRRAQEVFDMLRVLLETNELSHSLFQTEEGFEWFLHPIMELTKCMFGVLLAFTAGNLKLKTRETTIARVGPQSKDIEFEFLVPILHHVILENLHW